jgi:hypothetical protein
MSGKWICIKPGVTNFVHIGLVVEDLDETVRFLAVLGFDCGEPAPPSARPLRSRPLVPRQRTMELGDQTDRGLVQKPSSPPD